MLGIILVTVKKLHLFVNNMLWFRSVQSNEYTGHFSGRETITAYLVENNLVSDFEKFLKDNADLFLHLQGYTAEGGGKIVLENHSNKPLFFDSVMSSGTSALMLYFYWMNKADDISFLFIDEFDAYYHFELAQNIIKEMAKHSTIQTVLTSHNTHLADNNILWPDCYFIIDGSKIVSFANATSREIREGHNLEKMYRQGEFDV